MCCRSRSGSGGEVGFAGHMAVFQDFEMTQPICWSLGVHGEKMRADGKSEGGGNIADEFFVDEDFRAGRFAESDGAGGVGGRSCG